MLVTLIDLSGIFAMKWAAAAGHDIDAAANWTIARVCELAPDEGRTIICLDTGRSFRYEIHEAYKGTRPPKDEGYRTQLARVKERLTRDGFRLAGVDGFEADDVIATLCRAAVARGDEVHIVSADKDLMQLIGPAVRQTSPATGTTYDVEGVWQKFGVTPEQMHDLLSLMGDTSDNIPGVKGVGQKIAAAILAAHGGIGPLFVALAADECGTADGPIRGMTPGIAAKLRASWSDVMLSQRLVELRYDVPLDCEALLGGEQAGPPAVAAPAPVVGAVGHPEATAAIDIVEPREVDFGNGVKLVLQDGDGADDAVVDELVDQAAEEERHAAPAQPQIVDLGAALAASLGVPSKPAPAPQPTPAPRAPVTTAPRALGGSTMFKKATKEAARLRLGIGGAAGSGKTMTALLVASGLGKRIAVIDTERGSASKYVGEPGVPDFETCIVSPPYHPHRAIEALEGAAAAGFDVVILDSCSHFWHGPGGFLELVDAEVARMKSKGQKPDSFAAWKVVDPIYRSLIQAIVSCPFHVIVTMRAKMEYEKVQNDRGKTEIRPLGMKPEMRDGFEYEFDVFGLIDAEHDLAIQKTRCSALDRAIIHKPGPALAVTLLDWLGAPLVAGGEHDFARRITAATSTDALRAIAEEARTTLPEATRAALRPLFDRRYNEISRGIAA